MPITLTTILSTKEIIFDKPRFDKKKTKPMRYSDASFLTHLSDSTTTPSFGETYSGRTRNIASLVFSLVRVAERGTLTQAEFLSHAVQGSTFNPKGGAFYEEEDSEPKEGNLSAQGSEANQIPDAKGYMDKEEERTAPRFDAHPSGDFDTDTNITDEQRQLSAYHEMFHSRPEPPQLADVAPSARFDESDLVTRNDKPMPENESGQEARIVTEMLDATDRADQNSQYSNSSAKIAVSFHFDREEDEGSDFEAIIQPWSDQKGCEVCSVTRPDDPARPTRLVVLPFDEDENGNLRTRKLCGETHAKIAEEMIDMVTRAGFDPDFQSEWRPTSLQQLQKHGEDMLSLGGDRITRALQQGSGVISTISSLKTIQGAPAVAKETVLLGVYYL